MTLEFHPREEQTHTPSDLAHWNESYYMDFHRDDGSLGGYVRVGFYPALGVTWYWACVVGEGRPLVMVVDHEAPIPAPPSLDVTHGSLRASHRCEEPCQRLRVGLQAKAQVYEDATQVYHPSQSPAADSALDLELDLLWETDGPGGYQFSDYLRVGGPLSLIFLAISVLLIPLTLWALPVLLAAACLRRRKLLTRRLVGLALGLVVSDLAHHFIVLPLWVGNTGWHWP